MFFLSYSLTSYCFLLIGGSGPNLIIIKESVLWFRSHLQVCLGSVNTTSNDLLRADAQKLLPACVCMFLNFVFILIDRAKARSINARPA